MPDRIRTYDLRIRSPLLYPAELRAHVLSELKLITLEEISNRLSKII